MSTSAETSIITQVSKAVSNMTLALFLSAYENIITEETAKGTIRSDIKKLITLSEFINRDETTKVKCHLVNGIIVPISNDNTEKKSAASEAAVNAADAADTASKIPTTASDVKFCYYIIFKQLMDDVITVRDKLAIKDLNPEKFNAVCNTATSFLNSSDSINQKISFNGDKDHYLSYLEDTIMKSCKISDKALKTHIAIKCLNLFKNIAYVFATMQYNDPKTNVLIESNLLESLFRIHAIAERRLFTLDFVEVFVIPAAPAKKAASKPKSAVVKKVKKIVTTDLVAAPPSKPVQENGT